MKVGTLALTTALLAVPSVATADDPQDIVDRLPESAYAASITPLDDGITALENNVTALQRNIVEMDRQTTAGEETVISLASDILFDSDEATVPEQASTKVGDLVAGIPDGAAVDVHGHTDSIDTDEYNQDLSERRAEAVADILEEVRPDLELQIEGFGEREPVEPNEVDGEDNPEGRALNRRVEIRYES